MNIKDTYKLILFCISTVIRYFQSFNILVTFYFQIIIILIGYSYFLNENLIFDVFYDFNLDTKVYPK